MLTQRTEESNESNFKDINLEIHFVAGVSKNKDVLGNTLENFNIEWFTSERVRTIYQLIVDNYLKNNIVIDYISFAKTRDRDSTEHTLLLSVWKKIEYEKPNTTEASTIIAKQTLHNLYNLRSTQALAKFLIRKLKTAYDTKNYSTNDIVESIRDVRVDLANDGGAELTRLDNIYGDFKKRHKRAAEDPALNSGVLTGVPDIDMPMGGLRNGEFGIVLGPTASGKSIILMNFAINCWLHYGDAIIVTIEMSRDDYLDRIYSYLSHIKFNRFRREAINEKEWEYLDSIHKTVEKHHNRFHIIDMRRGCNMLALKANVDKIIQKHNVRGIFIDYLNIMSQENNTVSLDWQQQVGLAIQMKQQIARELHKPTWTLGQTTADNNGAAFGSHIKDQVDIALQLMPNDDTVQTGLLPARFLKTRNFKAARIVLETNYHIMHCKTPSLKTLRLAEKLEQYDAKIKI